MATVIRPLPFTKLPDSPAAPTRSLSNSGSPLAKGPEQQSSQSPSKNLQSLKAIDVTDPSPKAVAALVLRKRSVDDRWHFFDEADVALSRTYNVRLEPHSVKIKKEVLNGRTAVDLLTPRHKEFDDVNQINRGAFLQAVKFKAEDKDDEIDPDSSTPPGSHSPLAMRLMLHNIYHKA